MATTPDRSAIFHGPGKVTFDSVDIFSEKEITATLEEKFFEVGADPFGPLQNRVEDRSVKVKLTPKAWEPKLIPYGALQIGQSIYGATDKPLTIIPRLGSGAGVLVGNAAITSLPSLNFHATKPLLGDVEWTGIVANASDPAVRSSWYSTPANAAALTGFDVTKVLNGIYTASWRGVTGFWGEDGFKVDFDLGTEAHKVDGITYDMILTKLMASCKCVPVGPALSALLALMGDVGPGGTPTAGDLVITGPLVFTLKNCQLRMATGRAGAGVKRVGEVEFVSQRSQTAGVLDPLYTAALGA